MNSWTPISEDQVKALLSNELLLCSPEQRALFDSFRVPLRKVPIVRHGAVEMVYVVAQNGNSVLYYEDVEEEFNPSSLGPRGEIAAPCFEQWKLSNALANWV